MGPASPCLTSHSYPGGGGGGQGSIPFLPFLPAVEASWSRKPESPEAFPGLVPSALLGEGRENSWVSDPTAGAEPVSFFFSMSLHAR